ncbi:FAD-dependent monooxygenase [Amycolatopsis sp.]|uniref:FAD-dependent monooxygenase n=1 Tax=Amycolatopsis sp. TaxID=37632 RepID=UPI002D0676A1|nr:FAD-dependent monooxygenase [Amycolatopsis sp.]HVV13006.1 FAD-dependent monooxygenase [Amycolatopsis sp.]
MSTDRAVAVLGNGPVGQTTALLLARWGVPVVLLDGRAQRDLVGSKAICQQRDVLDVWESVGVGRRIAGEGVTWTTARTFYRDEELFAYSLPDAGRSAFPPFVNISQARTEELLDERIAATPLIDVRWGHQVTGLAQDTGGVTLTCANGQEIRADYVVACAGARADGIRAALGVRFDGHSFDDRFLICDIRAELPGWAAERRFYFDPSWNPGRQVLIHPCPGSTFRIDWQVPGGYDLGEEERTGALDRRIRAIIGETPYEIVWKSVYRFHSRVVDRMRAGRVLLAGDCAHLVSPFGARGLNSGVGDAENAAWKLAYVLHGWAGEELLETYHEERHAAAQENIEVTTATMDFLVPQNEEQHRTRRTVLAGAAADPALRARVDSGRLSEPFWYAESRLTTSDSSRPFRGRPARGCVPAAGPGILVPDAPVSAAGRTRFRELARDGFLVLATEGAECAELPTSPGPVRLVKLAGIDASGALAEALAVRPGELWLIRPDAYVAAVVTSWADLAPALHRALGRAAVTLEECRKWTRSPSPG